MDLHCTIYALLPMYVLYNIQRIKDLFLVWTENQDGFRFLFAEWLRATVKLCFDH